MVKVQHQLDRFQNAITSGFYYTLRIILSVAIGFLTAKCELFENFSPFSLILLSVSPQIGLIPTFCYLGCALGVLTSPFDLSVFKYITALTMIYVVYMVFNKSIRIIKNDTAVLSAACCFTAGFLFLLVDRINLFNVLILTAESVLVCCCIFFVSYAAKAFRNCCYLTSRELIAVIITLVLILISLHNVNILNLSVARIVAIALLLLALCCLKTSHTAVLGSCLGIIMAAIADGGDAIFTAMIVGTLAGCVFSSFSERFSMTLFLLAYNVVLFFFGKFPWDFWYFAEPMVAYTAVLIIPKKRLRTFLSSYITIKNDKKSIVKDKEEKKLVECCKEECRIICPKFKSCYEKNLLELSEALDVLSEQFYQTERLGNVEDVLGFCIKPNTMAEIVEKQLVSRSSEEFDDLIVQLDRLSRKIERKINASAQTVRFMSDEECQIKADLEKRRLAVKDINFIIDEKDCKRCDIQFVSKGDVLYKKIISEVVGPYFENKFSLRILENENGYTAYLRESDCFSISCAALCKTKSGEQISGDTALGFSGGKGKYYLILADGMGSGKEASAQSELLIRTVRHLITGGLSISNALNIYRSAARFRQDNYFTTIDICAIDLCAGVAEFYKAGAFDSYHLQGEQLNVVKGGGMPLGLSENDRLYHLGIKFEDRDYLILASDGLSLLGDRIGETLIRCRDDDVRTYSKNILRTIAEECDPCTCDDITIMVCKFYKKTE